MKKVLALATTLAAFFAVSIQADPASASSPYPHVIGADYAWFHPTLSQLNYPGIGGPYVGWVARYVGSGSSGKRLTVAERNWLVKSGVWKGVVFNSEGTGREVLGGFSAGRAQALAAWRDPAYVHGYPLILSIDFDYGGSPVAYLNGAASVVGKANVGVYGSVRVVKKACTAGFVHTNWATYAWRYGQSWPDGSCAPIRQVRNGALWGGQGDIDIQVGPYRFYGPGRTMVPLTPVPSPKPAPKPVTHVTHHSSVSHVTVVTVHRGDTLSSIAKRFHTTWRNLARINHLRNPNLIYPGQRIRI